MTIDSDGENFDTGVDWCYQLRLVICLLEMVMIIVVSMELVDVVVTDAKMMIGNDGEISDIGVDWRYQLRIMTMIVEECMVFDDVLVLISGW